MQMLVRSDVPVTTLRFDTALPEAAYEVCRLQMTLAHAKRMIEVMCKTLDHYPTKPTAAKKKTGRKKKST